MLTFYNNGIVIGLRNVIKNGYRQKVSKPISNGNEKISLDKIIRLNDTYVVKNFDKIVWKSE